MKPIPSSQITPEHIYLSRRRLLKTALLSAVSLPLAACARSVSPTQTSLPGNPPQYTDEVGDQAASYELITSFNNFYEFSLDKRSVAQLSSSFQTSPWVVAVGGLVQNPRSFDIDDLRKNFEQEDRIYRMRCVEGWSMVIPWLGFPLSRLLTLVQPTSEARFVRFETLLDPQQMPGQKDKAFQWPYIEGLTIDEAMHDLTILATGIYGKQLLPQNGAPVRLVVPWKYGFKSIKSIFRIELVSEMPTSLWMAYNSQEYGFYANVNPKVPHPRWSQATERRYPETTRRETLLFNGYPEVADLYERLDLNKWY